MITNILSIVLSTIFLFFSLIHFYWLFGGKWSLEKVIPTKIKEVNTIPIPKFATLIVALVFSLISLIYFIKSGIVNIETPNWIGNYYYIVPSLFLVRTIGDFKYVGFFKSIKTTTFSKWDRKLFVPLCLLISITGYIIAFLD